MDPRAKLRAAGAAIRAQLGLAAAQDSLAPGLSSLVDEVAFGRLWGRPGLSLELRMLATLSALTSRQYLPQLEVYAGAARALGISARAIQEVMIHCALYAGLPSAENSLAAVARALQSRGETAPEETLSPLPLDALERLGVETMEALHAERAAGGYAAAESAAAALYDTARQYGYGEIWNRPGLDRRERMVCSIAAFTALELESQQRKFFRSALNVGLSREEILETINQTGPYSGFPPALNALVVAEAALAR